jgi:predicted dehydrogenase
MAKKCNVALLGQGFMGRTHSNAWLKAAKFFTDLPLQPVMHTTFGMPAERPEVFAERWGWQNFTTDWEKLVQDPAIDLVDIVSPNNMHAPMAIAAIKAGKPVSCEKPLASTLAEAREMCDLAKKHKAKTFVWYNYRRCPAVGLAHRLVKAGKIGRVYHVRCVYLQDWAGPQVPLLWRFDKKLAGSGAHGDLNAHIIDMARFVTGDEISEIVGAISETFIKERTLPSALAAGGIAAGSKGGAKKGKVTVDDAVLFLARFKGGAVASFEATRFATGCKNWNGFEIHGEKGAVRFNFEDMNRLWYYDATADAAVQGWTNIMCTDGSHPYVRNWWPAAHILGYEHGFINEAADIMSILGGKEPEVPIPTFADAYETQRVLEAALMSADERKPIKLADVK